MKYAQMSNGRAEKLVGSIEELVAELVFQEQQICIAEKRPVLYRYQIKAKYSPPNPFQFKYGRVPRMCGVERLLAKAPLVYYHGNWS